MHRLLLVHGPNLNRLGSRDRSVYGDVTLAEIVEALTVRGRDHGWEVLAESFRHPLVTATAAARVIAGKGLEGYLEALEYVAGDR